MSVPVENIFGVLSLFTAILYLVQLFISKPLGESSSKLIIAYFASLAFIVFFFSAYDNGYEKISRNLIPLLVFTTLGLSPTIYLYLKELTSRKAEKKYSKHYILPIAFGALATVLHLLIYIPIVRSIYTYLVLFSISALFVGQSVFYIYHSLKRYKEHQRAIPNIFSYVENVKLDWVRVMIYGFVAFVTGLIIIHIIDDSLGDIAFDLLMLGYISYTGYHALKQTTIYKGLPVATEEVPIEHVPNEGNQEPTKEETIVDNKLDALKDKIIEVVETEQLYLNQEFNVFDLASKVESNSKYVSQAINSGIGKSFIQFVNQYRIEEAKRLLVDETKANITIEGLGQLAGFKSKSTFNTAFKKATGLTPSEFKKKA